MVCPLLVAEVVVESVGFLVPNGMDSNGSSRTKSCYNGSLQMTTIIHDTLWVSFPGLELLIVNVNRRPDWLNGFRTNKKKRSLLPNKAIQLLERLPKWSWQVGQLPICGDHGLQGWMAKYEAVRKWIEDHGGKYPRKQIPSSSESDNQQLETTLGSWIQHQYDPKRNSDSRVIGMWQGIDRCRLLEQLPNWGSTGPYGGGLTPWKVMFDRVFEFYQINSRLPARDGDDAEVELAEWYYGDRCNSNPNKIEDERTRSKWLADFRELREWAEPAPAEKQFRMLTV